MRPGRRSLIPRCSAGSSRWPRRHRNAHGWARSRRWRWCRHARTLGAPTGTGSIPCPASGRAARSGTRRSGASTTGSQSGSLGTVSPCMGSSCTWPRSGTSWSRWSRDLPSVPSSVTVIREPDGRYYASFVVERATTPLPVCGREIGVDVGLSSLAVTSDGEVIGNPRFMRTKERKLARAQRALSRKQKGSANRAKARKRVAVVHRKVRESRLDHAHKTALRLVRDNQAVYAEDLCVSGLARTRLARSVHDAGWSQLAAAGRGKGCSVRADVRQDRPVRAHQPGVLGVRGEGRPQAAAMSASGRARRAGRSTTGTSTQLRTSWPPGGRTSQTPAEGV